VDDARDGSALCPDDVRVARNLGTPAPAAAPAVRATRPGWRDPRLWLGIAIVAACVVAGARILGSADETVAVWALAHDEAPGVRLTEDDLTTHRVRFADADDLHGYFRADRPLPDDLLLVHGLGAGELLPRSAVGGVRGDLMQVPVALDPARVPPGIDTGSVVDVYVAGPGSARGGDPGPALAGVSVVAVVSAADSLTGSGQEQLTLAVPEEDAQDFVTRVGSSDQVVVTVVGRP
jgi:hypothetical protein